MSVDVRSSGKGSHPQRPSDYEVDYILIMRGWQALEKASDSNLDVVSVNGGDKMRRCDGAKMHQVA
jgi:hypothetical protein